MEAFTWDKSFVTGLDGVDQQHFYLVGLINQFGKLLAQNELSEKELESIFQELHDYTFYHFQHEEKLMKRAGIDFQFFSLHSDAHQNFLLEITVMQAEISVDNNASLRDFFDFLTHWLAYHILGMDQNMARQIAAIENGCSPEQAYQATSIEVDDATEALLRALNYMFKQVSERNKELHQLNKTLEMQVAQRTQALLEANQHLQRIAVTDVLTELPNRRYAMSHLSLLWGKAEQQNNPLSCLMIDVDYFKEVNDKYGHCAGDQVLIELSQRLQQTLRTDDIICRLGGDEFLVICENTDFAGARYIAQLLCSSVAELKVNVGKGGTWFGSVSIGVATKQDKMLEMDELIKMADQGVYQAKKAGKSCVKSSC
ncbi:MAG: bacteriohemerythrin [Psychromonas sp.]|nr:bacteriohemerythrin [Psychromonas sp.]